jgi:hypothetical protein
VRHERSGTSFFGYDGLVGWVSGAEDVEKPRHPPENTRQAATAAGRGGELPPLRESMTAQWNTHVWDPQT